jgi:hypothetical protein
MWLRQVAAGPAFQMRSVQITLKEARSRKDRIRLKIHGLDWMNLNPSSLVAADWQKLTGKS